MHTAIKTQNLSIMIALQEVFRNFSYILLAGLISVGFFVFAVWLPNFRLVFHTIVRSDTVLSEKLNLLLNLMGSISTNFTVFSAISTIIIAILFGINIAIIAYFIRKRKVVLGSGSFFASFGGISSGIVGIGCAACGSLVLSTFLPVIGAVGVIALLPLKGKEFSILSIGLLLVSIFAIARKIIEPVVCKPITSQP